MMAGSLDRLAAFDAAAAHKVRIRIAGLLLVFLLVFGGGGSPSPLAELACELATALAICAWVLLVPATPDSGASAVSARPALAVAVLLVVIPTAQLVPLPPGLWQAMPGREAVRDSLALVDAAHTWRPISIAPLATLSSLLSLLPPLTIMLMVSRLDDNGRLTVITLIAGFGLVSVLLGTLQMASAGGNALMFYGQPDRGVLFGFQANRNTEADILLCGLIALGALRGAGRRIRGRALDLAYAALGILLVLAAVLTRSRTGIFLIPLALGFGLAAAIPGGLRQFVAGMTWRRASAGLFLVVAAAVAGLLLARTPVLAQVIARFDFSREFRPELWTDTRFAIAQFWPVGSGLGTFMQAFQPAERLEVLDPLLANRAHNDYLEAALEGGVPLLLAWGAAVAIVFSRLFAAARKRLVLPRPQRLFAMGVLFLVALHSIVDYPLRSMAMAALTAAAAGLVLAARAAGSGRKLTDLKEDR